MSVTTRIRLVGAIASSIAVAVGVFVVSSVWMASDEFPGLIGVGSALAVMGMLLTTTTCVALTLSVNSRDRRLRPNSETTRPLQPETLYRFPPV
jgi:hypothetical protein